MMMNKYHNKKTNGYASVKEAKRAQELKLLEKAGEIHNLQEQVKFVLIPKQDGERECSYFADFVYLDNRMNRIVEDVKGFRTPLYIMKRKLMRRVHGIRIKEI